MINLIVFLRIYMFMALMVNKFFCSTVIVSYKRFIYKNKVKNKDNFTLLFVEIKFKA